MVYSPERDLIGYGSNPPDPAWPDGARLALNFVLNYEEGSEYSIPDNDARSDSALTEVGGREVEEVIERGLHGLPA